MGFDDFTEPAAKLESFAKTAQLKQAGEVLRQVQCLSEAIVPPPLELPQTRSACVAVDAIREIRGIRVILDSDRGALDAVPAKSLNLAVRRNRSRFPPAPCSGSRKKDVPFEVKLKPQSREEADSKFAWVFEALRALNQSVGAQHRRSGSGALRIDTAAFAG